MEGAVSYSGIVLRLSQIYCSYTTEEVPASLPKDRRPPEVFFSRCPLVFMLQKKTKKNKKRKEMNKGRRRKEEEFCNKNPPTPTCLSQAPASTQKTKRKTRPAIHRSARWRARI